MEIVFIWIAKIGGVAYAVERVCNLLIASFKTKKIIEEVSHNEEKVSDVSKEI